MTSQYPTQPGWATQTPPAPQPPRRRSRRSRRTAILMASAAAILGLIVIGRLTEDPATTTTPAPAARADAPAATSPPAPEPSYATPKASDFDLTVKVLEKTNFGSAGSSITYRIEADWPAMTYDPDKTYEVVYEVRGGEDGAQINTMEVTGFDYQVEAEEFISTPTVGSRLTAKATSVTER